MHDAPIGGRPGDDLVLHHGHGADRVEAALNLRGGGLRALVVDGLDLVESYPAGSAAPACAGAVLFPWPNRIRDGRWSQRGVDHRLPVNETDRRTASHGLVRDTVFDLAAAPGAAGPPTEATLTTRVMPRPGYPFAVDLAVTYRLTGRGIEVRHRIVNRCGWAAPVCLGGHPYLRIGDLPTDALTLTVRAGAYFTHDERLLPVGVRDVTGTPVDLRGGRRLAGEVVNHCFGALEETGGPHRHRLAAPGGRAVELWTDPDFGFVQVYTSPDFPRAGPHGAATPGRAVAVEPMTAPPDAFNSGIGLRWLEPAEEWTLSWGLTYHA